MISQQEVKSPYVSQDARIASSPHEPVDSGMGLNSYSLSNKYGGNRSKMGASPQVQPGINPNHI